jgi:hypothetical protein
VSGVGPVDSHRVVDVETTGTTAAPEHAAAQGGEDAPREARGEGEDDAVTRDGPERQRDGAETLDAELGVEPRGGDARGRARPAPRQDLDRALRRAAARGVERAVARGVAAAAAGRGEGRCEGGGERGRRRGGEGGARALEPRGGGHGLLERVRARLGLARALVRGRHLPPSRGHGLVVLRPGRAKGDLQKLHALAEPLGLELRLTRALALASAQHGRHRAGAREDARRARGPRCGPGRRARRAKNAAPGATDFGRHHVPPGGPRIPEESIRAKRSAQGSIGPRGRRVFEFARVILF